MKFVIKWTVVAQEVEGNMWNSNPHVKVSFSKILKLYLIQSSECVCVCLLVRLESIPFKPTTILVFIFDYILYYNYLAEWTLALFHFVASRSL